jgi:hypothetical protein
MGDSLLGGQALTPRPPLPNAGRGGAGKGTGDPAPLAGLHSHVAFQFRP